MKKPPSTPPPPQPAPLHYCVEVLDAHAHLFTVTLTIAQPAALQRVALPVWIPGSYLVREFSKNLQGLQARQGARTPAPVEQLDKCTWQIDCKPGKAVVISYQVYAHDNAVRTAWLDAERGFFNGTSLCLKVEGQENAVHLLELPVPTLASSVSPGWSVATGLAALTTDKQGFGTYTAASYDELVDCPVEMGTFWSGTFTACGIPHRFVVAGSLPTFDGARLLADAKKICQEGIRFWHGKKATPENVPFANYLLMLNAVDDGYGGLEHRNSTALMCARKDLPRVGDAKVSDGYTTLRGLISHEYFHTWNVKRLRPAEFKTYQYDRENYTQLLWFFEGFTSYYDDLLLRRAGLLDNAGYIKLLNKTINQVMQTPGRLVQSVAQASFDAWVKYYRQDENTPNATVSYYTKGSLVALCLDLTLRLEGHTTLDDVMRALWERCSGGPMCEADLAAVLQALGKRSFASELADWVHGTGDLPLKGFLYMHGVTVHEEPAQLAHRLGLRVSEAQGVLVKTVLRGGAAERAGFAPGDEWLGLEVPAKPNKKAKNGAPVPTASGWRMSRLDDALLYAGDAQKVIALVSRDKRLLRLALDMPPLTTWQLTVRDAASVERWLR